MIFFNIQDHKLVFSLVIRYPKTDLWISKNQIMDIQNLIFGYHKIKMIFGYPWFYFWVY